MAGLVKELHYDAQPASPTGGARGGVRQDAEGLFAADWRSSRVGCGGMLSACLRATKEANLAGCRQSAIDNCTMTRSPLRRLEGLAGGWRREC